METTIVHRGYIGDNVKENENYYKYFEFREQGLGSRV